jgi:hypothetical protein
MSCKPSVKYDVPLKAVSVKVMKGNTKVLVPPAVTHGLGKDGPCMRKLATKYVAVVLLAIMLFSVCSLKVSFLPTNKTRV